jgi:ribosome production factor 2
MAPMMKHAKTRKGKKYLENRQPKFFENDKQVLIAKGGKCSEMVSLALAELYALKKPLAQQLKR